MNGSDNDRYGRATINENGIRLHRRRKREPGGIKRGPLSSHRKIMSWWRRELASRGDVCGYINVAIIFFDCGI